jgi:DNA repair protein RecO
MQALVIRRSPVREHDQLVVLYGPDTGRMPAIAKGSLRSASRQALALDEGNLILCDLVAGRGDMAILTGSQSQRSWSNAKSSPAAWAVAQFFLQAIDAVVYDGQPDARLWGVIHSAFERLDNGNAPIAVLREGQVAMLEALGYGQRPVPSAVAARSDLDDEFDRIAQRHLSALDLVYQVAQ